MNRKTFLKTAFGTGLAAVVPNHLRELGDDPAELAGAVSGPTRHYRQMESAVSSDELAPAVDAHLTLATGIVQRSLRTSTGFGVLAEISGLAAWLAADRGDNASARRRYAEAINQAERAHHPLLVSYMTASLGAFAVEAGHASHGVKVIDRAASQLDRDAPDAARAWLVSLHAVAHATLGDVTATLTALRAAEKYAGRQGGEPRWPWVFPFTASKAARYQAGALSRLGNLRAATDAFDAARPALTSPKPRALAQLDHALVLATAGLIGEACHLALNALRVGRDYGSERITAKVRDFRATLPALTVETRELDDALASLYETEA